jgi:hypothetical protein
MEGAMLVPDATAARASNRSLLRTQPGVIRPLWKAQRGARPRWASGRRALPWHPVGGPTRSVERHAFEVQ